jgi:hypothetical protein
VLRLGVGFGIAAAGALGALGGVGSAAALPVPEAVSSNPSTSVDPPTAPSTPTPTPTPTSTPDAPDPVATEVTVTTVDRIDYGTPLTLSAKVADDAGRPASGSVQFSVDDEPVGAPVELADGVAELVYASSTSRGTAAPVIAEPPSVRVGARFIPSDADLLAPSEGASVVTVRQAATATAIEFTDERVLQSGRVVAATASIVRSPVGDGSFELPGVTGAVEFYFDGALVATAEVFTVEGDPRAYAITDITLGGAGDRSLVAAFTGDRVYAGSTSRTAVVPVAPAPNPAPSPVVDPVAPQPPAENAAPGAAAGAPATPAPSSPSATPDAQSIASTTAAEDARLAPGFWLVFIAIFAGLLLVASSVALVVTQVRHRRRA